MGQPCKYTPDLEKRLCALVRQGVPIRYALQSEGISHKTLRNWRERGATGEEPFATFATNLSAAFGQVVGSMAMNIINAAEGGDWKAAAWWLERRAQHFAPPKQSMRVEKAPTELSDAELQAAVAALGYVKAGSGSDD
jgi:hypothetical protein